MIGKRRSLLLGLAVCLPVPIFAGSGLALPLPPIVERLAASLASGGSAVIAFDPSKPATSDVMPLIVPSSEETASAEAEALLAEQHAELESPDPTATLPRAVPLQLDRRPDNRDRAEDRRKPKKDGVAEPTGGQPPADESGHEAEQGQSASPSGGSKNGSHSGGHEPASTGGGAGSKEKQSVPEDKAAPAPTAKDEQDGESTPGDGGKEGTKTGPVAEAVEQTGLADVVQDTGLADVIHDTGLGEVVEDAGLGDVVESTGLGDVVTGGSSGPSGDGNGGSGSNSGSSGSSDNSGPGSDNSGPGSDNSGSSGSGSSGSGSSGGLGGLVGGLLGGLLGG